MNFVWSSVLNRVSWLLENDVVICGCKQVFRKFPSHLHVCMVPYAHSLGLRYLRWINQHFSCSSWLANIVSHQTIFVEVELEPNVNVSWKLSPVYGRSRQLTFSHRRNRGISCSRIRLQWLPFRFVGSFVLCLCQSCRRKRYWLIILLYLTATF